MKFFADMGIPRRTVADLQVAGHDAVHAADLQMQRSADDAILERAVTDRRVLLTFDLDFGEILARSGARAVSVVVFRMRDTRADALNARLREVIAGASEALASGAVVIVEDGRYRVRRLPIER